MVKNLLQRAASYSIIAVFVFLMFNNGVMAQKINSLFYGQNAWMPSFSFNGQFESLCDNLKLSGDKTYKLIRIGGTTFDEVAPTIDQYVAIIDKIRSIGAEPLVQVAVSQSVSWAGNLVNEINNVRGRNVKYWCIGNEYDLGWKDRTVSGVFVNSAAAVAQLFVPRAGAMKAKDNTIKIFGPDWSFFVDVVDDAAWNPMGTWHYPMLDNNYSNIWGKDANGNYYVDYYAFHVYQKVAVSNVERKLKTVLDKLAAINVNRDANNKIGWAITETHINTNNDQATEHDKTWGFYAGQQIAQIFGLAMKYSAFTVCPWAMHESGGARTQYDLGFFDAAPAFKPRSTHYHENMLSVKAKWNYLYGYINNSNVSLVATKDETGYAIMIMNDNNVSYNYAIRLNYDAISSLPLVINLDAKNAKTVNQNLTIGANETNMVFLDANGDYIGRIVYNKANADAGQGPAYIGNCPDRGSDTNTNTTCTSYALPGRLEAENYCTMSQIQVETTSDAGGGQNIGYCDPNDWIDYNVNVPTAGNYKIDFRLANGLTTNGQFQLLNGSNLITTVDVAPTGGWQTWSTISKSVTLSAGSQTLRIKIITSGVNLNWINVATESTCNFSLNVEAESYSSMGGTPGVQIETCSEGGQNVGYIDAGDWMAYNAITIPTAGAYQITYRVASMNGGGSFKLEKDAGATVLDNITVPATNGWQTWTSVVHTVNLPAGTYGIGVGVVTGGFNLNWLKFNCTSLKSLELTGKDVLEAINIYPNPAHDQINVDLQAITEITKVSIFNLQGKMLYEKNMEEAGILTILTNNFLTTGIYIVKISNASNSTIKKLIIK